MGKDATLDAYDNQAFGETSEDSKSTQNYTNQTQLDITLKHPTKPVKTIHGKDNTYTSYAKAHQMERQLTVMLLAVSVAFLLLTLPLFVRNCIYTLDNPMRSSHTYALYFFLYHFSNKFYMTNNAAINFYLYCITGSKFRQDLVELFGCCGKRKMDPIQPLKSTLLILRRHKQ